MLQIGKCTKWNKKYAKKEFYWIDKVSKAKTIIFNSILNKKVILNYVVYSHTGSVTRSQTDTPSYRVVVLLTKEIMIEKKKHFNNDKNKL